MFRLYLPSEYIRFTRSFKYKSRINTIKNSLIIIILYEYNFHEIQTLTIISQMAV